MMKRIAGEGLVAGAMGAAAVAAWFLIVDLIAGQPFFTPSVLGQAFFFGGVQDPTVASVTFPSVVAYTMVHVLAFVFLATIAAFLACQIERVPATLFLVVVLFAIYEFGFYIVVAILAQPLLGVLAWFNVAIGNAIAALCVGYYLWRAHPRLREELKAQPLGHVAD